MSYLFYVDTKENVVLRPECLKLCPELTVLSDKEILFVILYADYHSIYHQRPENERIRSAMYHAFEDNVVGLMDKPKIKNAIIAYISLQYNDKLELIKRYRIKLDRLSQRFLSPEYDDDSPTSNNNAMKNIDMLRNSIRELEHEVSEQMNDEGQVKANQQLSWLEILESNQKRFKAVTAPK